MLVASKMSTDPDEVNGAHARVLPPKAELTLAAQLRALPQVQKLQQAIDISHNVGYITLIHDVPPGTVDPDGWLHASFSLPNIISSTHCTDDSVLRAGKLHGV
jgi:hypothetical protein